MRSDVRALLRMFLWAGAGGLLVMAWLVAAVLLQLNREVAIGIGLGLLLVGGAALGVRFASGLFLPPPGKHAEPGAAPDRRGT